MGAIHSTIKFRFQFLKFSFLVKRNGIFNLTEPVTSNWLFAVQLVCYLSTITSEQTILIQQNNNKIIIEWLGARLT